MKAIVVVDIDSNHMFKEANKLYDRLLGYKCKLIPMPQYNPDKNRYFDECEEAFKDGYYACINDILEAE